jgi:WD repeat-containing protein 19
LVRVLLENLNDVDSAIKIIRKTHSRESAKLIIKFLQEKSDYKSVIEFCLMAGMDKEAYEIAHVKNFLVNPIVQRSNGILC